MTPTTAIAQTFTVSERRTLRSLRARYRQDRDLFTKQEREQLHFLKWLYQTGRLPS